MHSFLLPGCCCCWGRIGAVAAAAALAAAPAAPAAPDAPDAPAAATYTTTSAATKDHTVHIACLRHPTRDPPPATAHLQLCLQPKTHKLHPISHANQLQPITSTSKSMSTRQTDRQTASQPHQLQPASYVNCSQPAHLHPHEARWLHALDVYPPPPPTHTRMHTWLVTMVHAARASLIRPHGPSYGSPSSRATRGVAVRGDVVELVMVTAVAAALPAMIDLSGGWWSMVATLMVMVRGCCW